MNNLKKLQDFIVGILDSLSNPLVVISFLLAGYGAYEINYPTSPLNIRIESTKQIAIEVRGELYYTLMYDIMKQSELIKKDPSLIMKSDLDNLQRVCGNPSFVEFVKSKPGEPFVADVGVSCATINRIRYNDYVYKIENLYKIKAKD